MGKSFFDIYEPQEQPKTVVQTITNITVPKEVHAEPDPTKEDELDDLKEREE